VLEDHYADAVLELKLKRSIDVSKGRKASRRVSHICVKPSRSQSLELLSKSVSFVTEWFLCTFFSFFFEFQVELPESVDQLIKEEESRNPLGTVCWIFSYLIYITATRFDGFWTFQKEFSDQPPPSIIKLRMESILVYEWVYEHSEGNHIIKCVTPFQIHRKVTPTKWNQFLLCRQKNRLFPPLSLVGYQQRCVQQRSQNLQSESCFNAREKFYYSEKRVPRRRK
jgi:hypothetical protein